MNGQDDTVSSGLTITGFNGFERIGAGGFSTVYRAGEEAMGRDVAIKVLHSDFAAESDRRTFERECRTLGVLSRHPNIVTVYSAAMTGEGRPCIVMELYRETLRDRLEHGALALADVLGFGVKIAGALQSAHQAGVLHRDLKPHNIFVSDYGEPALGDFGISTVDEERSVSGAGGLSVAYAAPELLEDGVASVASDVYALGATMYHLVGGRPPFESSQLRTTVRRILTEEVPQPGVEVPPTVMSLLRRAMAKDPSERPPSAAALVSEICDVQRSLGYEVTAVAVMGGSRSDEGSAAGSGARSAAGTTSGTDGDLERTRSRRRSGADEAVEADDDPVGPVPVSRRPTPPAAGTPSDDGAEQTIRRTRALADPAATAAESDADGAGPSTSRRLVAAGLGAGVVVAAAIAMSAVRGGGRGDGEGTTVTTLGEIVVVPPDDGFFESIDAPANFGAEVGPDGTVILAFENVTGATGYEAVSRAPSALVGEVRGDAVPDPTSPGGAGLLIDTGLTVDDAACWTVRSIGEQRRSRDSGLECARL